MASINDAGKKVADGLYTVYPTGLLILGAAVMAVGVGMIYFPAGLIAGGGMAVAAGVFLIRGGDDNG